MGLKLNKKKGPFTGQYSVCIGSCHYGQYPVFRKFHCIKDDARSYLGVNVLFDPDDIYDTLHDSGISKMGDWEVQHGYLKKILKKRIERGKIYDLNNLGQTKDPDTGATYLELSGTEEDFQKWIKYLGKYIVDEAPNVGGDDTFFDYYPDLLDTFAQVCHAFDKNDYCLNMLNTPTMHKHYWNRGAELGPEDVIYNKDYIAIKAKLDLETTLDKIT